MCYMKTTIMNYNTNTKRVTATHNCSSVICAIITTIHRSRLKNTTIFVFRCQYLSVTFAKILSGIKMEEKHKMSKDQQTFYWCNICNYKIKLAFLLHNYKKSCKRDKEKIMQLMEMDYLTTMTERSRVRPISKLYLSCSNKNEKQ